MGLGLAVECNSSHCCKSVSQPLTNIKLEFNRKYKKNKKNIFRRSSHKTQNNSTYNLATPMQGIYLYSLHFLVLPLHQNRIRPKAKTFGSPDWYYFHLSLHFQRHDASLCQFRLQLNLSFLRHFLQLFLTGVFLGN